MKFEFTTTACLRPELLDRTYSALSNNLLDVDIKTEGTLYINIDPIPPRPDAEINDVIETAKKYFKTVHYNIGSENGNFAAAINWVFSQPKGEYFFHIEDDWEAKKPFKMEKIINILKNNPKFLECIINGEPHSLYKEEHKPLAKKRNRACFWPSAWNTKMIQEILKLFPVPQDKDPEQWIWHLKFLDNKDPKNPSPYFYYDVSFSKDRGCFHDIGRKWFFEHKDAGLSRFTRTLTVYNDFKDKFKNWRF